MLQLLRQLNRILFGVCPECLGYWCVVYIVYGDEAEKVHKEHRDHSKGFMR